MVHWDGFPPQLFDLEADPHELTDLGRDTAHEPLRRQLKERIFEWMRGRKNRIAVPDSVVEARGAQRNEGGDVLIGRWD